jgi:hypothetical protein
MSLSEILSDDDLSDLKCGSRCLLADEILVHEASQDRFFDGSNFQSLLGDPESPSANVDADPTSTVPETAKPSKSKKVIPAGGGPSKRL